MPRKKTPIGSSPRKKHPKVSAPQLPQQLEITKYQRDSLKELQSEIRDRKLEALRLYRPNTNQEKIHECRASEILVIGGNRSGKSLSTFVEDARCVTNQDPYGKYPKEGILVVVGKDWKHIGLVCVPLDRRAHV